MNKKLWCTSKVVVLPSILWFPCPHVSVFKSNLSIHTYLTSSGFTLVPRTPRGILATMHASSCHLEYSIHSKQLGSILLSHLVNLILFFLCVFFFFVCCVYVVVVIFLFLLPVAIASAEHKDPTSNVSLTDPRFRFWEEIPWPLALLKRFLDPFTRHRTNFRPAEKFGSI